MKVMRAEGCHLDQVMGIWKEFMDLHSLIDPYYVRTDDGHLLFADYLERKMGEDGSLVLVAVEDGDVLGYCFSYIHERPPVFVERKIGVISDLAVRSDSRRGGVGEALLQATLDWFRKKGLALAELRTSASNGMAISFYSKHGFRIYDHEMTKEL